MNVYETVKKRRSIRKYSSRPVEFEKVSAMVESATYAPSAGNLQEWKFIVITDKTIITQIANYSFQQYWIAKAPIIIVACSLFEKQEKFYGQKGKDVYDLQSVAAAIENMILVGTDLGLATCWVTGFEEHHLKDVLYIPANVRIHALVTVGYPDEKPAEKHRIEMDSCVYFNKYGVPVKNLNILLNDYSEEIAKKIHESKPMVEGLLDKVRNLKNKVRKK
jgi:nitroreductase